MLNVIPTIADKIQETIDPQYLRDKLEAKKGLQKDKENSIQALAASIGLSILGYGLSNCGVVGSLVSMPILMVSLPAGYLTYNSYKTSVNMSDILDNPKKYQTLDGLSQIYSEDLLKEKLRKETICFEWATDPLAERIVQYSKENPNSFEWVAFADTLTQEIDEPQTVPTPNTDT